MNYRQCIKYLFSLEREGIKYDLKNIRALVSALSNPHKKFASVHIAGTNGKGSVASMINSVLIEAGFNTGLYTSPHITDFRERILINGIKIPRKYILDFTLRYKRQIQKIKPSFFEVTTAMAFGYFADKKVDFAVIETGMGGRLDSTNILKPLISIITGISIDHTEYLGNTITEISKEKAGIIKRNIPVVCGNVIPEAKELIKNISARKKSEFIYSTSHCRLSDVTISKDGIKFRYSGGNLKSDAFIPLTGKYQLLNIKTAISALSVLNKKGFLKISDSDIKNGFRKILINSSLRHRFEIISEYPFVITDVSHNEEGIRNLRDNLKNIKYGKLYIIFGMMKDKNYSACVREISSLGGEVILTKPAYKRAEEPLNLRNFLAEKSESRIIGKPAEALKYALGKAGKKDAILITGSFYLLGDLAEYLKNKN